MFEDKLSMFRLQIVIMLQQVIKRIILVDKVVDTKILTDQAKS